MAYYRKLKNGKYEFSVEVGKDPATGKRKRKYKTFERVKDGQQWVAEMKLKVSKGLPVVTEDVTFLEFCEKFVKEYVLPNLSPTTADGYISILKNHLAPAFGAAKMKDIKAMHIDTYINRKRGELSERTLLHHFRLMSKILHQAERWDVIEYNPIKKAEAPKPVKKEAKVYSREMIQDLLTVSKAVDYWMYRFILIDLNTGLRISEMLGQQEDYIDLETKQLSVRETVVKKSGQGAIFKPVPKSDSSRRTIEIPDLIIPVLEEIFEENEENRKKFGNRYYTERNLVFCKPDGTHYYPTTINRRFNKIKKLAGINDKELNIHSLRHTHATMLMELGWPDRAIQERLGHSSSQITKDTYSHVRTEYEKRLVGVLEEEMKNILG